MPDRPRYSRADLPRLQDMSRPEILDLFGSFEDRGLDDDAFILEAANLIDPSRVAGLAEAVAAGNPQAIGNAVLAACMSSTNGAPEQDPAVIQSADEVLANTFTFYGEAHTLSEDIGWDSNPGTGHWGHDLNRFSYLTPLVQAHFMTGDAKYARKAVDLILSWIARCEIEKCFEGTPYMFGSYLNNTIHCSAWARTLETLLPTGHVQPIELLRILKSLQEQIAYLEIVTNGHAGNWPTIGCQGCLATMASLPVLRDQDRFTAYYIETLANQVEEQILPDGVQDELTPHYHSVVVNNILTCAESCAKLGLSLQPRTLDTLKQMVRYQEQTVTPNRNAHVAFNDSDPQHVPDSSRRLRALGLDSHIPDPDSLGPEAYPYAGVAFLRQLPSEGDLYLAFDGGPFGRGHQHEDKLGFWLFANGRNLIVDPGRHLYDSTEISYRPYLITTKAHSTITVDGEDQNSRAHRDTWIAKEPGSLTFYDEGSVRPSASRGPAGDVTDVRASSTYELGYGATGAIQVTHAREIVFVDNRFWVLFDSVEGDGEHLIESRFQFAPGDVSISGNHAVTQYDDANLLLAATGDWDTVRVHEGEENPRAGWYSAGYNKIEPAPQLCFSRNAALPLHYAVLLLPYTGASTPEASIDLKDKAATVSISGTTYSVTPS